MPEHDLPPPNQLARGPSSGRLEYPKSRTYQNNETILIPGDQARSGQRKGLLSSGSFFFDYPLPGPPRLTWKQSGGSLPQEKDVSKPYCRAAIVTGALYLMFNPQGDIGVNATERAILALGWIYRRQNQADFGIDGQIEIVDEDGLPRGRLIGVQVKSGKSFVAEAKDEHIIFRTDGRHAEYWRRHALPVIVAIHDPSHDDVYWQKLSSDTLIPTGSGYRVVIPRNQRLDEDSRDALLDLTTGSLRERRLARLLTDRLIMEALRRREAVVRVSIYEHTYSIRGEVLFAVYSVSNDGVRTDLSSFVVAHRLGVFKKTERIEKMLHLLFPWAAISVDEDFYETTNDYEFWIHSLRRQSDPEYVEQYFRENPVSRIRPYALVADESLDLYQVKLELNDIGRAYILLNGYLDSENPFT